MALHLAAAQAAEVLTADPPPLAERPSHKFWRVAADALVMVQARATTGLGLGLIAGRFIEALLYKVKPSDPQMVAFPWLVLLATALFATIPALRSGRYESTR